ncbi:hypothetical protein [Thalassospira sp.]|uniref:hypothetical protein n=1 Tax=Thalassospira sp. TaxID=1912094 RepID=UPI002733FA26|nr:hypothetical protein [Thalassospira sp.]MDP2700245.1 hypothetical protein [Thalassospira sp.]
MSENILVKVLPYLSPIMVVLIGAYLNHYLWISRTRSKDHCEMVEKFVGDRDISTTHNLLLETQFRTLYKRQAEASIIRFLLDCSYPILRINQYKIGHNYLEKCTDNIGKVTGFNLISRIRNETKRRWIYWGYMTTYTGIVLGTMYPIITYKVQILEFFDRFGYSLLIPLMGLIIVAIGTAFIALTEAVQIDNAAKLVEALDQENTRANDSAGFEETP